MDFEKMADAIVETFPTEVTATYFIPAIGPCQASGKLFSVYKNLRLKIQEAGLAEKRHKNTSI